MILKAPARLDRHTLCDLMAARGQHQRDLFRRASALRDDGRGRVITYSRKVFLPLTHLCRDYCDYCTFRKDPHQTRVAMMSVSKVREKLVRGEDLGCREALFSLGDKPEASFPEMRRHLRARGFRTTVDYLVSICRLTLLESRLLPHSNPGLMSEQTLRRLRPTNPSVGLMLENISPRLMGPGMCHERAPDKDPRLRMRTIEAAGRLGIPFTTGILVGIDETVPERVDSLLAIRKLHERFGHIQEVIIQNFRTKPGIPMAEHPEPSLDEHMRTISVARLILGGDMNVQAPPNLAADEFPRLLEAGINDWGGVSPLTPDFINPEAPWPHLRHLGDQTRRAGFELRERLPVYPEFLDHAAAGSRELAERLSELADRDGFSGRR